MAKLEFNSETHQRETIEKFKKMLSTDIRLNNRMRDSDPRAAAKILASRIGNAGGIIRTVRLAVNELLAERGQSLVTDDWEGTVKAPF